MQGLRALCATPEASLRALRGGADLICIGNNLQAEQEACVRAAEQLAALCGTDATLAARVGEAAGRVAARKRAAG